MTRGDSNPFRSDGLVLILNETNTLHLDICITFLFDRSIYSFYFYATTLIINIYRDVLKSASLFRLRVSIELEMKVV
jgi:hypothetical protein